MTRDAALSRILDALGLDADPASAVPLAGGCIDDVRAVNLRDGRRVVVKLAAAARAGRLDEEARGLGALGATGTVRVPAVLGRAESGGVAGLVMEHLAPGDADDAAWAAFGRDLAALHATPAGARYGHDFDNHLGPTPQVNTWEDDWVVFNQRCRLGPLVARAADAGHLRPDETARLERFVARLDDHLPRRPRPSLLHGDLWSGNALPTAADGGTRIAVIDPAPSVGDGWADIAMMRLFGGFSDSCFVAYGEAAGGEPDDLERRLAVYRLYHLLNHVVLFGRGYAASALAIVG